MTPTTRYLIIEFLTFLFKAFSSKLQLFFILLFFLVVAIYEMPGSDLAHRRLIYGIIVLHERIIGNSHALFFVMRVGSGIADNRDRV